MTTETQKNVHEGKYGFYPCNYENYQKIRRLYGYYLLALSRAADMTRWSRKQPQNRVLRRWIKDQQGRRCGCQIIGPRPQPEAVPIFTEKTKRKSWSGLDLGEQISIINSHIEQNYRSARYPVQRAEDVIPLTLTEAEIDSMLAILDTWKAEHSKK